MLAAIFFILFMLVIAYPLGIAIESLESIPIDFYWDKGPEELL